MPSFNLENELLRFKNDGFTVNFCDQAYVTDRYLDVGALVWYAKVLPWFPPYSFGFLLRTMSMKRCCTLGI